MMVIEDKGVLPTRKGKFKGRWTPKQYTQELIDFTNKDMSEGEQKIYRTLYDNLVEENKIKKSNELLLLDMIVFDYMRIKRLHQQIMKHGDLVKFTTRAGTEVIKAAEASYLLNAVQTQMRNNMKELLLTRKEMTKAQLGKSTSDFAKMISAFDNDKVVDVDETKEKTDKA